MTTDWQSTTAVVTSCRLSWLRSFYDIPLTGELGLSIYKVQFKYEVHGRTYRNTKVMTVPMAAGESIPIMYDPSKPQRILDAFQVLAWRDPRKWIAIAIGTAITLTIIYFHS